MPHPLNQGKTEAGCPNLRPFFFTLFYLFFLSTAGASDYAFRDDLGNEVELPKDKLVYSRKNPGPWTAAQAGIHEPRAESTFRKEGLEDIRVVKLSFSHPASEKEGRIEKIYLTDKDGLVIGYKAFASTEKTFTADFKVNGVINYIRIYVECSRHGTWGAETRF